jgi:hypothetical protein
MFQGVGQALTLFQDLWALAVLSFALESRFQYFVLVQT